ncbi:Uma2 family endonuclease [Kitasatospora sp. MAP12-15]|uniref:Uma2 family endonuclease n=1 Tax=unclassified Kitasatospora TaxID=2633591 RepID=UPI0024748B61|nr:Uma2 family endonuclease [Kitasatospora sp. MAP12-44]MDH6112957.1 Uma2 family endonuclease [Kitasatospora sp. MAP12-44]
MTALTHDYSEIAGADEGGLLDAFLALETPEGFKAELIEGEIIVTPPPDGDHEAAIGRIVKQVYWNRVVDVDFAANKGLIVPGGRFIPDGTFGQDGVFDGKPSWMKSDGVIMVVEVTSSRPEKDREGKRKGYAAADIPLYLLVDRQQNRVFLHSDPVDGDYHSTTWVPVGEPLDLPAPFGFALQTDRLH